ncbi:MAG: hypothetical protein L3K09_02660 [Thermoplasmata archaeon]|nr:hypothetical protein [Thermoplasmata archaeon]
MSSGAPSPGTHPPSRELLLLCVAFLPFIALGAVGSRGPLLGAAVPAFGWAAALLLGLRPPVGLRWAQYLPLGAAVAFGCAVAPAGVFSDMLAGVGGLLVLAVYASGSGPPGPKGRLAGGLLLPGMALAVALAIAVALPTSEQYEGLAAALLAGVFLLLAWLFRVSTATTETLPSAS